jgi:hypothetical protein
MLTSEILDFQHPRSAAMIMMYAMIEKGMSLPDAQKLIINKRDPGDPGPGIWNSLVKIEQARAASASQL